ncbi:MAG: DUF3810 family protein [Planctomycetota bacterium]|nr:DUF3810 family protein [Planctomycetota bacterium]
MKSCVERRRGDFLGKLASQGHNPSDAPMATTARKRKIWLRSLVIATLAHVLLFLVVPVPAQLVETVHARGVFPALRLVLATPAAAVPFSVGEVMLGAFLLVGAGAAVQAIAWALGKARSCSLSVVFLWFAIIVTQVYLLGFAWLYRRPSLAQRMALPEVAGVAAMGEAATSTATAAAAARCEPGGLTLDQLDQLAREAIVGVLPDIAASLPAAGPKRIWPEGALMLFDVAGIFWPFSQEPHVDPGLDRLQYAFVACHELAHLAGIASEDEANFVAWLACTRSPHPFVRYAGHFGALRYFAADSPEVWKLAGESVVADMRRLQQRWQRFRSPRAARFRLVIHDAALRSQGESRGIESYDDMVRLIVRWQARGR